MPNARYEAVCTALPADSKRYTESDPGRVVFTTEGEEPEPPVEQSFEITVGNVTSNTGEVTVIPVIKNQYYRIIAFREDLPDETVLKMMTDDVGAYVEEYGWEQSVENGLFFIGDTENFEFNQFPDGQTARFFVVGFDFRDGAAVATTGLFKSERFTTPEIVESDAWVNMTPGYTYQNGEMILLTTFSANETAREVKAAVWYVFNVYGDPTSLAECGYNEEGIRATLLSDSASDIDMAAENYLATAVNPGEVRLFGVLGIDENGVPGNANWIVIKAPAEIDGTHTVLCQSENNDPGLDGELPDMTVSCKVSDAAELNPSYAGRPLLSLEFSPNAFCTDYHYSVEDPDTFAGYGEKYAAFYLTSEDNRWNDEYEWGWRERADTDDGTGEPTDRDSFVLMPYYRGVNAEVFYICFGTDDVRSRAMYMTVEIPVDLSAAGETVPATFRMAPSRTHVRISPAVEMSPRARYGLR